MTRRRSNGLPSGDGPRRARRLQNVAGSLAARPATSDETVADPEEILLPWWALGSLAAGRTFTAGRIELAKDSNRRTAECRTRRHEAVALEAVWLLRPAWCALMRRSLVLRRRLAYVRSRLVLVRRRTRSVVIVRRSARCAGAMRSRLALVRVSRSGNVVWARDVVAVFGIDAMVKKSGLKKNDPGPLMDRSHFSVSG